MCIHIHDSRRGNEKRNEMEKANVNGPVDETMVWIRMETKDNMNEYSVQMRNGIDSRIIANFRW